jgi:putative cardiolipin synthase
VFALHAKTLVIDATAVFIGTYNLDPRSENLNTEAGVVIEDAVVADGVARNILTDMRAENSWDAAKDDPDQFASVAKRSKVRFWQVLPIKPLL